MDIGVGGGGISNLSELTIDADKNWAAKNITNLTSLTLVGEAPSPPVADRLYKDNIIKGWVRFDGDSGGSINDSFNVSSVTDNGVGDYSVNWDLDFASTSFSCVAFSNEFHITSWGLAVGLTTVATWDENHAPADAYRVYVFAIGDQ
ncbi:hypothetical protein ES703_55986 [subsurface metagenome]